MHIGTPPFVDEDVPEELQWEINAELNRVGRDTDGPCLWLDLETKKCKHYENRPEICETFERGGIVCLEFRSEAKIEQAVASCRGEMNKPSR